MTIAEMVVDKLRELPAEKQKQVLDYVESLKENGDSETPRRSLLGLRAGMGFDVTAEDIAEARREMWGNFPRDMP